MQSGSSLVSVVVLPPEVQFYSEDRKTHKQVVSLFNLYDVAIRFRVLSSCPQKYRVVEPEGSLKPYSTSSIIIKHTDIKPSNCNVTDKFRIQFLDFTTKKVIGKRDITATLNAGLPEEEEIEDEASEIRRPRNISSALNLELEDKSSDQISVKSQSGTSPSPLVPIIGVICIAVLIIAHEDEKTSFPFKLSCNMKMVLAYVLGLVSMVIFRSN